MFIIFICHLYAAVLPCKPTLKSDLNFLDVRQWVQVDLYPLWGSLSNGKWRSIIINKPWAHIQVYACKYNHQLKFKAKYLNENRSFVFIYFKSDGSWTGGWKENTKWPSALVMCENKNSKEKREWKYCTWSEFQQVSSSSSTKCLGPNSLIALLSTELTLQINDFGDIDRYCGLIPFFKYNRISTRGTRIYSIKKSRFTSQFTVTNYTINFKN